MLVRNLFQRLKNRALRKTDSGAAAIEFALVLPLLITFLYGVVTYGYILSLQQGITQAATEGSRAAAITTTSESNSARSTKAKAAINRVMAGYNSQCDSGGTTCTVAIAPCSNDSARNCATVTVTYNWAASPKIPPFPLLPVPERIKRVSVIEVS